MSESFAALVWWAFWLFGRAPVARPRARAQAAPKPRIQTREVIGKTTQVVKKVDEELANGAQKASTVIEADPITISSKAYVSSIDRISMMNIDHAIELYNAEHGSYPKNYQEFMDEIIKPGKPDGIQLPQLPYYQEYGYDEKEHKLIVLEYPARKEQMKQQKPY